MLRNTAMSLLIKPDGTEPEPLPYKCDQKTNKSSLRGPGLERSDQL